MAKRERKEATNVSWWLNATGLERRPRGSSTG
jgi:hypothetical protein